MLEWGIVSQCMERAGSLLARLRLAGVELSLEERIQGAWVQAVGKRIAGHARAGALAGSLLIVEVDDEVWQRQLSFLGDQILARLNQTLGGQMVSRIQFRLSLPRRMPQRATTACGDEAEAIADAGLRMAYRLSRRKTSA